MYKLIASNILFIILMLLFMSGFLIVMISWILCRVDALLVHDSLLFDTNGNFPVIVARTLLGADKLLYRCTLFQPLYSCSLS